MMRVSTGGYVSPPAYPKFVRRALRFHRNGDNGHALLELKAASEAKGWFFYLVRGRVHAALKNHPEAIADYMHVLIESNSLNSRNKMKLLRSIVLYSGNLAGENKAELANLLRRDFSFNESEWFTDGWLETWQLMQTTVYATSSSSIKSGGTGRIANIGKFLLDAADLQKLNDIVSNRPKDSNIRILTTWDSSKVSAEKRRGFEWRSFGFS